MYKAFISYARKPDRRFCRSFAREVSRAGYPWQPREWLKLYRDETHFMTGGSLTHEIKVALRESTFLILLASPEAAHSDWVANEVSRWLSDKPPDTVLIVLTRGVIKWDSASNDFDWSATTALPPILRGVFGADPIYEDCREQVHEDRTLAVTRVAARLREVKPEAIVNEARRQRTRMTTALGLIGAAIALVSVFAAFQWWRAGREMRVATERLEQRFLQSAHTAAGQQQPLLEAHYLAKLAAFSQEIADRERIPLSFSDFVGPLQLESQIDESHCVAVAASVTALVTKCTDGVSFWRVRPEAKRLAHWCQGPTGVVGVGGRDEVLAFCGGKAALWSLAGVQLAPALDHPDEVAGGVASEDTNRLLTWSREDSLRLWARETGTVLRE